MGTSPKQPYEPPKVVHVEKIKARAVTCQAADDTACGGGPINS